MEIFHSVTLRSLSFFLRTLRLSEKLYKRITERQVSDAPIAPQAATGDDSSTAAGYKKKLTD